MVLRLSYAIKSSRYASEQMPTTSKLVLAYLIPKLAKKQDEAALRIGLTIFIYILTSNTAGGVIILSPSAYNMFAFCV